MTLMTPPHHAPCDQRALATLIQAEPSARAVGSQTSKSPCFKTEGAVIHLDHFHQVEFRGDGRVEVGSGVILSDLLQQLSERGLALPTLGEWSGQTMGGAISTATHGGSYHYGSLASSVSALTLMDGRGEVKRWTQADPEWRHLLPSFGTTGVTLSYELVCEPTFKVALERRAVDFSSYLDELLTHPQGADCPLFKSSIWLPALDQVVDYEGRRVDSGAPQSSGNERTRRETRFNAPVMILDWLSQQLARSGRDFAGETWRGRRASAISRGMMRPFGTRRYLGDYLDMIAPLRGEAEKILKKRARNRTPPEGEFAVPLASARPLIEELRARFARSGHYPDRPIGLRPGAAEGGSLFAAQGEPCVWVSLFIYPDNPLMADLPQLLLDHQARPHWGKCVFHPIDQLHTLYPEWDKFKAFRDQLDPERRFINDFAQRLGL